jgi:NAD+ synthase
MFIQVISYGGFRRMKLSKEVLNIDPEFVEKRVLKFIRSRVTDADFSGAVVGLSGGIDSAIVAALCVRALGPDRVLGLMLPEKDSDPNDVKDAVKLVKQLKNPYEIVDITSIINACRETYLKDASDAPTVVGNVKARVRMLTLYYYANKLRRLVVGTGNKSEILIGYS